MFYALDSAGIRIAAAPKAKASCPCCGGAVRAKCGQLVSRHWAHVEADCDPWTEPMTEWHHAWQAEFPEVCREFVVTLNGQRHRADVLAPSGFVIEFQHSSISPEEITAREAFYPRMVWVFDARDAHALFNNYDQYGGVSSVDRRLSLRQRRPDGYVTFRWKHPRTSISVCRTPVFLDLGDDELLRLGKIHKGPPTGGWGHVLSRAQFVAAFGGAQ